MKRSMTRKLIRNSSRNAFTLLELLIVLAILGVIAAMVVPNLLGSQKKANIQATETSIHGLEQALKLYAVANGGEYPNGGQEVFELLASNKDSEGNAVDPLLPEIPKDAWGQELMYEYPSSKNNGTEPAIWSLGPNKSDEQGSGDDVANWGET
ncbi:MAG TPA: type II secretion protein [Planctomycetaceae bacterium]|nr:type II secretion protein [Planctomycetaceae bacterium]|tara:strand:+ start:817 stop:1275 length:459 start_codon:yes stop_codon:yes gene_type:complete